jgi:hypothetical protein
MISNKKTKYTNNTSSFSPPVKKIKYNSPLHTPPINNVKNTNISPVKKVTLNNINYNNKKSVIQKNSLLKSMKINENSMKQQNYEEIFANTFLKTQYVTIELTKIINDELTELFDNLPLMEIFTAENIIKGSVNRSILSSKSQSNIYRENAITKRKRSLGTNSNSSRTSKKRKMNSIGKVFTGGDINCQDNMIWCLEYGIPDTLHDFGKSRNYIFPSNAIGYQNKSFSSLFLQKAIEFLQNNYREQFNLSKEQLFNKDVLFPIYEKTPMNFEEETKTQYLLGFLCGDKIDNISYYFSEDQIPESWNDLKRAFFVKNKPNRLNSSFFDIIKNYQYYILDACMTVQKETQFKDNIKQIKSLCNLWDPAGAGSVETIDDGNEDLGLILVQEPYNTTIFNSVVRNSTQTSFYDGTYDRLLNKFCLEKYGIYFKLRLAFQNNNYMIALVINTPTIQNNVFILENGGFSVKVLSAGLYYIETNDKKVLNDKRQQASLNKLIEIINFVKNNLTNVTNTEKQNLLYILLTRFKSTGDHGSAIATKFVNEILKKPTIYLTGDQLAYVYSICQSVPTLFRFFNGKGDDNDDDDDDTNGESCSVDRTHFLGLYSGNTNEIELTTYKYITIKSFFSDYNLNGNETLSNIQNIIDYLEFNNKELKMMMVELSVLNIGSPDYGIKKADIENKLNNISMNIFIDENYISNQSNENNQLPIIKKYLQQLMEMRDYFFILKHIDTFKVELIKQIKEQINDYSKIVKINADEIFSQEKIQQRRSTRERFVEFADFGINKFYSDIKKADFPSFIRTLKTTIVDEKSSFLDKIIEIKSNMKNRYKKLETFIEQEFSMSSQSLKEISKNVFNIYKTSLIEKTNKTKDENLKNHFVSLIFEKSISELEKEKGVPITITNTKKDKINILSKMKTPIVDTTKKMKNTLKNTMKMVSTKIRKTLKNTPS